MRFSRKTLISICVVTLLVSGSVAYLTAKDNSNPKDMLVLVLNAAKAGDVDTFIKNSYDKRIPNGSLDERREFYKDIFEDKSAQIDTYEILREQVISKNEYKYFVNIVTTDGSNTETPISIRRKGLKWMAEFGEDIKD